VLRAAGDLLASDEAARIRECGGEDCGWMYVDRSRNGLRRWCQMEVCGTKEKSRQRALRRAEAE
jgi:predicted RNA-binding Zn ribbon-like protein